MDQRYSRTQYAAKNFLFSTIGTIVTSLLSFVSRTIFIYTLGTVYLGINGLFTNVLGMLSFAELGIGAIIGFCLYKPLAEQDTEKIKAYIKFYKNAYRIIALVVTTIGLIIIPFLKYIVNGADDVNNLVFIYCVFLFNTVSSYLITYKTTILNADQKNYLLTNINTVFKILLTIAQVAVLLIFNDYIVYLVIQSLMTLIEKIYINIFINKRYPYLKEKNTVPLSKDEKDTLYSKIKAMIFHKIGEVSVFQTDNIITSAFINVIAVGLVSNFVMVIMLISTFVGAFFNASVAGFGNIIATETKKSQFLIFKKYNFIAFWLYGVSALCLYFLLPDFITAWIGSDKLIDKLTIFLLCVNYYIKGLRIPISNIKSAAGVFEPDRYAPLVEAAINIIVSIIGVKLWGLPGIYIGTLLSSFVPVIIGSSVVYRHVFGIECKTYFVEYVKRILLIAVSALLIYLLCGLVNVNNIYIKIALKLIIGLIIPHLIIFIVYRKSNECKYVIVMIKRVLSGIFKKIQNR